MSDNVEQLKQEIERLRAELADTKRELVEWQEIAAQYHQDDESNSQRSGTVR